MIVKFTKHREEERRKRYVKAKAKRQAALHCEAADSDNSDCDSTCDCAHYTKGTMHMDGFNGPDILERRMA